MKLCCLPSVVSLVMFTTALAAGGPPDGAAGVVREDVVVEGKAVHAIQRQLQVRDCAGEALARFHPDDLRVMLVPLGAGRSGAREAEGATICRREAPIALTLIVDTSSSMRDTVEFSSELAWQLFSRLGPSDRFRLITFAEHAARFNEFATAEAYIRAAVLAHVRQALQSPEPPSWLPKGLAASRQGARAAWQALPPIWADDRLSAEHAAVLGRWFDDADADTRKEVIEQALRAHFRAALRPGGRSCPGPALEEAFRALMARGRDGFVPAFDANLGLVLVANESAMPVIDPTMRAILSVLLVQHWSIFPRGGGFDPFGPGRGVDVAGVVPEAIADRIATALRAVHELSLEVDDASFTRPGGVRVEWIGDRAGCHHVVIPDESLPPRAVFEAVADTPRGDTPRARRQDFLERLAAESPSAREALRGFK